jgi:pimeloyl-ACP methyl ester carboxylesterase
MTTPPIILVPGFWLGAWAWDEVAAGLRERGHQVTALTLPGLDSVDTDRSSITATDHLEAITDAVRAAGRPVVLAVHSAAGFAGYAATDRVPELIAAMVYVDSGAGVGAPDAGFTSVEKPLPSAEELAKNENLDGLSEAQLQTLRERAVPEPGGVLRESLELTNDARLDIPTTMICTAYSIAEYEDAVKEGYDFIVGLRDLRNLSWVELPTSHWPMWSKSQELTDILAGVASAHASEE